MRSSRRSRGALGLAVAVAVALAWVMVPTAAVAANYSTVATCSAIAQCTQGETTPASGAGKVTVFGGGTTAGQVFTVEKQPGVTITKVEATYSDGTTQTQPTDQTTYIFGPPDVSPTRFVTRFEVFWNDHTATTTTSSSTTSSTSSSSTSSTSSTSTTTTTTPRADPGTLVNVRPDGDVRSSPDAAAVRGYESAVDVVVRGNDDAFWWTHWNGSSWSLWSGLGTPPVGADGDPTIASWGPGRLDVFVRGNDGDLWQIFSDDYGAHWSPWLEPVGDEGELVRWPEVSSRGPGLYDVFVLGTDGQIWQRFWDKDHWNAGWLGQGRPSVGVSGEPATVSRDWNHVDLFVWGADDRLYQRSWSGETGWLDWTAPRSPDPKVPPPRALVRSSPDVASSGPDTLLVFVKGSDDHAYALVYGTQRTDVAPRWGDDWQRIGGPDAVLFNGPGATSRGLTTRGDPAFDVFVRGTDNKLYQIFQH